MAYLTSPHHYQSYFRETGIPPGLCTLLSFPPSIGFQEPPPQDFALQFWDDQKLNNASYVVAIIGMLLSSKGGSVSPLVSICLPT